MTRSPLNIEETGLVQGPYHIGDCSFHNFEALDSAHGEASDRDSPSDAPEVLEGLNGRPNIVHFPAFRG